MSDSAGRASDSVADLQRLIRWEESGGVWEVATRGPVGTTFALLRCDAGEEMDRFTTTDRATLAYAEGRTRSDHPAPSRPNRDG